MKYTLKTKAIQLRQEGLSYLEILAQVPVAKSTLSLWLRSVDLSKRQYQRLTQKKLAAAKRGAEVRKKQRLTQIEELLIQGKEDISSINKREAFLIGIALYWAEGAKQKEHNVAQAVSFDNSDVRMIRIFLQWLDTICNIKIEDLIFHLYIHQTGNTEGALLYWSNNLHIPINDIKVYYKKHTIRTNRKNTGINYHGLLRVKVRRSTVLNRRISAWIHNIYIAYGEWCNGNTPAFGAARL